jgi:uncharacterized membrane protein YbhN (UPF0104 family)
MDLSRVNKHSNRTLAFSAVFWSCSGGLWLGQGIQQLVHAKWEYTWIASFLMGLAFLAYGIFWSVMLVRRAAVVSKVDSH